MSSTLEPELDRDVPDIAALKQGPRVMWAAGDYPTLAARMPSRGSPAPGGPAPIRA